MSLVSGSHDAGSLIPLCNGSFFLRSGIPHTGLKKEALSIILTLTTRLIERKATNELSLVKKTFNEILQTLERDNAPEVKIRLKDIDDKLKNV